MLLVVDANVLVSELLRMRGRALIGDRSLRLRISEEALNEALHEMRRRAAKIVAQGRANREDMDATLNDALIIMRRWVVTMPREVYVEFEERAA